jgi:hypothetical protein
VITYESRETKLTASSAEGGEDLSLPLVLDLDGTLLRTDLLVESVLAFVVMRPWNLFHVVAWLLQGKAVLKRPGCRGGDLGENLSCSN